MSMTLLNRGQRRLHRPRIPGAACGLSVQLRESTSAAHAAVEAAFALERRLASRDAYNDLLIALRGFYQPVEAALMMVPGWEQLSPPVDVRARCRATLLDNDLGRIDWDARGPARVLMPLPLGTLAQALGCLYVLEGSALGGRIVARQVQQMLGDKVPTAFFSSTSRVDLGADWRALQAALDAFGGGDAPTRRAVVTAAQATFEALSAWLEQEGCSDERLSRARA